MINKWKLSCKEATRLMEEKHRRGLSWGERVKLVRHSNLCDACRHYERQSRFLEKLLKPSEDAPVTPEIEKASKELERKIM